MSNVWLQMQRSVFNALNVEQPIVIHLRQDSGWRQYPTKARIVKVDESMLVDNGTLQIGDKRIMISADVYPPIPRRLELKDRIEVDGQYKSVVDFDDTSRFAGGELVMYEVIVR